MEGIGLGNQPVINDLINISIHWDQRALTEVNYVDRQIVRDEQLLKCYIIDQNFRALKAEDRLDYR